MPRGRGGRRHRRWRGARRGEADDGEGSEAHGRGWRVVNLEISERVAACDRRNLPAARAYASGTPNARPFHVVSIRRRAAAVAAAVLIPTLLGAQVIDLTVHDVGLAIGDKPRM